jgi:ribosomal protein S18 acetylase RimI-like enzyme
LITLKQVDVESAMDFKSTRLAALKDSPTAFGSTFENESKLSDADWRQRAIDRDGATGITYLAWDDQAPCGIAAGFVAADAVVHIVSVWVAPTHRQRGVGKLLIQGIAGWALARNAAVLSLMVTSSNHAAICFYKGLGFEMTGRTKPYPNDPALIEYQMTADIHRVVRT